MNCKFRGLNQHTTRDAVQFSDAAAENSAVALFRPGHNATCKCMADGSDPEKCDGLYITDENGSRLATLHGADLRARELANKSIAVYRASVRSGDSRSDARPCRDHSDRLAALNSKNAEFWQRRNVED